MQRGEFREDLLYRLEVFDIRIPPLRERRADIVPLSDALLKDIARWMAARSPHNHKGEEMRIATFVTTAGLALLGTVALAKGVTYDYTRQADFSRFKTYAWTRGTELADELNHARIVRAVGAQLAAKGLTRVEPSVRPEVLVAYHASFERNLEIHGFSQDWGPLGLGPDRTGSARVQPVLVGTLVVDVIDARANAVVWRAVASSDINPATSPQKRDQRITGVTAKMFKNFPPKP